VLQYEHFSGLLTGSTVLCCTIISCTGSPIWDSARTWHLKTHISLYFAGISLSLIPGQGGGEGHRLDPLQEVPEASRVHVVLSSWPDVLLNLVHFLCDHLLIGGSVWARRRPSDWRPLAMVTCRPSSTSPAQQSVATTSGSDPWESTSLASAKAAYQHKEGRLLRVVSTNQRFDSLKVQTATGIFTNSNLHPNPT